MPLAIAMFLPLASVVITASLLLGDMRGLLALIPVAGLSIFVCMIAHEADAVSRHPAPAINNPERP